MNGMVIYATLVCFFTFFFVLSFIFSFSTCEYCFFCCRLALSLYILLFFARGKGVLTRPCVVFRLGSPSFVSIISDHCPHHPITISSFISFQGSRPAPSTLFLPRSTVLALPPCFFVGDVCMYTYIFLSLHSPYFFFCFKSLLSLLFLISFFFFLFNTFSHYSSLLLFHLSPFLTLYRSYFLAKSVCWPLLCGCNMGCSKGEHIEKRIG